VTAQRSRPVNDQTAPKHRANGYTNPSLYLAEDGYTAPTAEDRAVQRAIAVLREHGYGIAMRCLDCQHPITSTASLRRMRGPRCHATKTAVAE
jgi:hypothetical protein